MKSIHIMVAGALLALSGNAATEETLIHGTVFLSPAIITEDDPGGVEQVTDAGTDMRRMFDRRVDAFVDTEAHLFDAFYSEGLCIEFQVNVELGDAEEARALVDYYAPIIGRLPGFLRRDVMTVWMHPGDELFGGGNDNILIHVGATAERYIEDGVLEEALAHEAAHTSLDPTLAKSEEWREAQEADGAFISDYARDNPLREDVAETLVPWLAACCGDDRLDPETIETIQRLTANRMAVLERVTGEWSELPGYGGKAACEAAYADAD